MMQAIQLASFGDVNELNEVIVDQPQLLKKQVLVRNFATAIEPYDVKFVQGLMGEADRLPLIPGSSVVGEIVAVGSEVTAYHVGQRVAATRHHQTYAEFVPVGQSAIAVVPESVSDATAVAAALAGNAAYELIHTVMAVASEDRVLILGAGGQVGSVAVQVALATGAEVVAIAGPKDADRLHSYGDLQVFDYHTDFVGAIGQFDKVLDTVGGATVAQLRDNLTADGHIWSLVGGVADGVFTPEQFEMAFAKGKGDTLTALLDLIAAGKVVLEVGVTQPFNVENLRRLHQTARQHSLSGKQVLTFEH